MQLPAFIRDLVPLFLSRDLRPLRYDARIGAVVERLIAQGQAMLADPASVDEDALTPDPADRLASNLDSRPIRRLRPDVQGALPLRSDLHGRWFGHALAIVSSVAGEGHPTVSSFFWFGEAATVGMTRKALGILGGFLDAWKDGTLWRSKATRLEQPLPATIRHAQ